MGSPRALHMGPGLQSQGQDKCTRTIRHITLPSLPSQEDVMEGVSSKGMLLLLSSVDIVGTTTLSGSVSENTGHM